MLKKVLRRWRRLSFGVESTASGFGASGFSFRWLFCPRPGAKAGRSLSGPVVGFVVSGLELGVFARGGTGRDGSSDSEEFWRMDAGRERETTISRPCSPVVNMLCRFSRVLNPEAERRLARSMNAAPVEFERFDRLPNCLSSAAAVVLERRTLEIDMQRMPLADPFVGLASSFSGKAS